MRQELTHEQARFERLMQCMNIPKERQSYRHENVLWFLRNGAIVNTTHKHYLEAVKLAQKLS